MAQSYVHAVYQIVFATKFRDLTLWKPKRDELFAVIGQIVINRGCRVITVGGVEDHVHVALYLHQSVALADLVKQIKLGSSDYIKSNQQHFPAFIGWQRGYGAFTYPREAVPNLKRYIQNQENHHRNVNSKRELALMLESHGIAYDPKYFE